MEVFGIKFAPLNIPLERRLQTLSAAFFFCFTAFGIFICGLLFLYIFTTKLWWINCLYLCWLYYDLDSAESGGRYCPWVLKLKIWEHYKNYFPSDFVCPPEFKPDPSKNYLFCCFPHGVLPGGPYACQHTTKFREVFGKFVVKGAVLHGFFIAPFFREYALALGLISCTRKSLNYVLSKPEGGHVLILWPGGAEEALYTEKYVFIVKNRKGFIKLALENGTPLVPVITFGEINTFVQLKGEKIRKFQKFVKKVATFSPVIFNGRGFFQYSFGLLPYRTPLTTVLGVPIEVTKVTNPTTQQIEALHEKFVQELVNLFEQHKHKYVQDPQEKVVLL